MAKRTLRFTLALGLACLMLISACRASAPSRWDTAQEAPPAVEAPASDTATATDTEVLPGSSFNTFFPAEGDGYERIYTQEKSGFAEAKLKQDGAELAMLSVSDTASNPAATTKYQSSDRTIAGYPAKDIGSTATGILVGDRLQVKVLSRSDDFDVSDREAWLEKFDLAGLEALVQ
ncbi:MAG: hypothetical protein ACFB0C_15405 [Leptolyngbyaceae cyanobacterium]